MEQSPIRPLQVFLSHSSRDREKLQDIYERLMDSGIDVWISDENLIPGQDWQSEITKAVKTSDVVLLFLSNNALTRDGYFQKEIRLALEVAEQKPDGVIYIVPVRLEDCSVPEKVSRYHWINYFEDRAYAQLVRTLVAKAESLGLRLPVEGLLSIRNNLKNIKERRVPVAEAKVMVLGQGSVGKTSLIKRLLSNSFNTSERITEGISINQWSVANIHSPSRPLDTSNYSIRLNIWDMGGQEIMHATHQFFLTKNSLYLLVLDARLTQEENRVEYWLKIIQSFGGDSPVIIIGNKTDQHPLNIDRTSLRKKHPNIVGILETSAATGAGIEDLKGVIAEQVNNLPHVHDLLPETWFTVKSQINKISQERNFLAQNDYLSLCSENGITDELSQRTLIGFLNDLGVVLHFQDDPRLETLGILNPQWVTNGVYKILNSLLLFRNHGILSIAMLDEILALPDYPVNKRLFIVDMMKKFELCYDIESNRTYLIPDLLPKDEPFTGDWDDSLTFQFHYNVLPSSIITRFIVRMNSFIYKTVWRSGVILKSKDVTALVKADVEERKIYIWVNGNENMRRDFLSLIRGQFDSIHKSISKLEAREKVPVPNHPEIEPIDYALLLALESNGVDNYPVLFGDKVIDIKVSDLLSRIKVNNFLLERND